MHYLCRLLAMQGRRVEGRKSGAKRYGGKRAAGTLRKLSVKVADGWDRSRLGKTYGTPYLMTATIFVGAAQSYQMNRISR